MGKTVKKDNVKAAAKKPAAKKRAAPARKKAVAKKTAVPKKKATPKKRAAARKSASKHNVSDRERYEMIATMAYYRAEKRNFVPGQEQQDWLECELIVDQMLG